MSKSTIATVSNITVEIDIHIKADIDTVWRTLTQEINMWWSKDFFATKAENIVFEPKLGGHLYEALENEQGLTWYTVQAIEEPYLICLNGCMFADYGGPTISLLQLKLESIDGKTKLSIKDGIVGNITVKTEETVKQGWLELFEKGLKTYIENT